MVAFATLISTFGGIWLQKIIKDKNKKGELIDATSRNAEIINALKYLKEELNADRAYVFEFHNGSYFSSGNPMQKFTCSYEVVADGVSAECHNPGEYRMSNYNDYISQIIHERDYIITNIDNMTSDPLLKALLTKKGVQSLYNVPIRTFGGQTIGFIGLDYVKSPRALSDAEVNILRSAAKMIIGYIGR